ncbi:LLM class flavin-dependent oxidoreductase [Microbacteriaceae bacterium VKM Ac-2854]|nr:LLM class flavin-dependent oxidoreductase [Microbacteriaceae bacterium VKM Ac-2854]
MIVTALLSLESASTLDDAVQAAGALEAAGVAALAVLDAADTDEVATFESTTLAAHLAMTTDSIGVLGANSALYGFPYHAARRLSTLDHLANGRAGWLLRAATGAEEEAGYDWRSTLGRAEELHRASEYAEIALELWDSWEDGAQWPDAASGDYKDDARIHPIDYRSTAFRVAGPLDVPPSPARRPVLFGRIATPEEAAMLAPLLDVAIVVARDRSEAQALVAACGAASAVLLAVAIEHVSEATPLIVADLGIDGVALTGSLSAAAQIAAAALDLGAERPEADTLAEALGIDGRISYGGRAA